MKRSQYWNTTMAAMAMVVVMALGACSRNQTVVPTPAPPPAQPNPVPGAGGFFGAGSCGAAGGVPLNANGQPFYATLYGNYSSGGSMSLNLSYLSNAQANQTQNIIGSAQLSLPELAQIYPTGSTSICVSSVDAQSGQPIPGTLTYGYGAQVSLTMKGIMQVPGSSYGGYYPGGQAPLVPEYVQVDIQGQIDNGSGRFYGYVWVQIGQYSYYQLSYSAQ